MPDESPQNSVTFILGQLTAKVDLMLSNHLTATERHEALENRVTLLEKDKARVLGGALVITTLGGILLHYLFS